MATVCELHAAGIWVFFQYSALANMPEFATAFSCGANAPMVKTGAARCVVW